MAFVASLPSVQRFGLTVGTSPALCSPKAANSSGKRASFGFANAEARFSANLQRQMAAASTSVAGTSITMKMAAAIPATVVKELRDKTGAGMMDCKKALEETGGSMEKAAELLRQKGIASADKKSARKAGDGLVGSYIHHNNHIGVLIEVNCETDFVARREEFKEIVDNLAMQVAATPGVEFVSAAEIPEDVLAKEREIEMGREDLAKKPEKIRAQIVAGRVEKIMAERCLMNQPFLRDPNITVEEYIKSKIALLGENIQVRRFKKFTLGEY
eukprot:CAMPEP_0196658438 /NCGR_PEP_ID=MMETSP1086-20130531/29609_1 /TAXON_ID=77921 /ORGANISM="Cyanoptyche  gloeocystis , Strain SAG4.97" /LENGTH=271 /DNA_ID=CAMNT_0041992003 /DNA_START=79 /DNA_END=894 /DNA_ORIENTATION=+